MIEAPEEIKKLKNKIEILQDHETNLKSFLLHVFGIKTIPEEEAKKIIKEHRPSGNFLIIKDNCYMVIDNTNNNLLVAEFLNLEGAFTFLKTDIFVEVIKNAKKTS